MDRRRFILGLLASAAVVSTPRMDSGLELIAEAEAKEKAPISEAEFNRLMAYNIVDDILREYNIGSVDDSSYKRKVYDSDRHVMVLFYDNCGRGAKGLAILIGLLSQEFGSNFDVFGYKMSESAVKTPLDIYKHVSSTYDFKDTPTLLLYKQSNMPKKNETVEGNILNYTNLDRLFEIVTKYINQNIV